jgi:acetylornithine deacetylase/succinyl-diaminopimelate desuccinylase-like protein
VCLDAECGDYERLWLMTSLRGNLVGTLSVELLTEGVHSGMSTGIGASTFRILRGLIDRIENVHNGDLTLEELYVQTPRGRVEEARAAAQVLGERVAGKVPFVAGARAVSSDPAELLLNSTWKPTLTVTGADGLPPLANAGNVLLPKVAVKLSMRLPPTLPAERAIARVKEALEAAPPYGARVSFADAGAQAGWNAAELAPWLARAIDAGSESFFGPKALSMGSGGSIPFIGMLAARCPATQFLVTGILGPGSNAHGPNEFLDLACVKRLTGCVASVLEAHARRGA